MPSANKEKVSLTNIIQNVVDLFNQTSKTSIQFPQKNLEAWVYADKNQLLSVFNNLIKNAQQAVEDKKEPMLKVLLFEKEKHFEIQVIDNGIGIPQDMAHRVFVPNFTSKSSGTGLGLAISKQNSEGEIWFESKENNGSTFFVTLPKHSNFN
jgi:signal transduction histidine kinase